MDEIVNFARQRMADYSAKFGQVLPQQQDIAISCNGLCGDMCTGSCINRCDYSCRHSCQTSCLHSCQTSCLHSCQTQCNYACESFGFGTQQRGW